ncbi:MAG: pilus (MSHA type) biogenesis protein MshL [Methylotenera sp.]|nr:pilus (MSHA type) biogenesis protein MshL [Methylotenera sp.]
MNQKILSLLCVTLSLGVSACAHQSKVTPSTGHIDGQNTAGERKPASVVTAPSAIPKPITNNTYLPPPKPKAKEPIYSIVVYDTPVKEVLFAIARDSKLNVDIHPSIQGKVTLNAVDQTLPAILERLSKQVDLTYKIQGNVLTIAPDRPVLRTYKIDYVNMSRDTTGFIGAAAEISSTGQSASTGTGGSTTTTISNGNGASNSSRTSVTSDSKHHLWENLVKNLKELLAETDKEVIVSRYGDSENAITNASSNNSSTQNNSAEASRQSSETRDKARAEYKTLFASTVIANPETGVIAVRATARQHEKVQEFVDKVMGSAKKQVLIEASIVEVVLNDSYQAGIDWSRLNNPTSSSGFVFGQTLGSKSVNFNTKTGAFSAGGKNALGATTSAGLVAGYLNPVSAIGNIAASITLLEQFGNTRVLSSPKLMVLNNQTAVLKVVDNLVYFTIQSQISQSLTGGAGTNLKSVTTTANTVPVGVVMSVTPQINDTSFVNLDVRPTISRVLGFVDDPNPLLAEAGTVSSIPQIQVREMESVLNISSGNIAVLGGLMQDEIRNNTDSVPGLRALPGVGKIFRGKNDANKKTELVIFLRPTVITNASLESDELSTYKQYLPSQQLEKTLDAEGER